LSDQERLKSEHLDLARRHVEKYKEIGGRWGAGKIGDNPNYFENM